ncbi:ERF family protein [Nocardiopsis synnemataformans]|uniref:ERF family protein n=1 Tax=Nocardiopsis synnemataformans TaxID=61305 RepID=UPI003EC029BE
MPDTEASSEELPSIYQLIPRVMADIGAVGKEGLNREQGFKFRAAEDVVNEIKSALTRHGVFYAPTVLSRVAETRQTAKGRFLNVIHLEIRYDFYGPRGDSVPAVVWGEAQDSGDKSTNKAMTAALKYALTQVLNITTGEADPDYDSEEASHRPPTTDRVWWQDFIERLQSADTADVLDELRDEATDRFQRGGVAAYHQNILRKEFAKREQALTVRRRDA